MVVAVEHPGFQNDLDERVIEVSIVMPCLDEAETLAGCIQEVKEALSENEIDGEIVIADNGSTDGSQSIAETLGARGVRVTEKGYGSALRGGIEASRGQYVIMGDSDGSYNFAHIPLFLAALRDGNDLVMGNRFQGGIEPGAMPWHHRYLGNPVLTGIGRLFFACPAKDFHCGLRGFSKSAYRQMELSTTGMEFASEMVIKSALKGMRIAEVPTALRPDGRNRPPHLRSWRDGWRHLRFMLLYCPRWLFAFTGMFLLCVGLLTVGWIAVRANLPIFGVYLNVNGSLAAAMTATVGYQLLIFGMFARRLGVALGTHPANSLIRRLENRFSLEHGVICGLLGAISGVVILTFAFLMWRETGFRAMSSLLTTRYVIPSVTLISLGVQTVFGSFLLGMISFIRPQATRNVSPDAS